MIQQKQFGVWMDTQQGHHCRKRRYRNRELKILARTKGKMLPRIAAKE
ncbi:MAG: hypothetical protein IPK90_12380 [Chitinophagaceae bacterium]|nr:hypothetical protein [Chitinophagaceae bacterium]